MMCVSDTFYSLISLTLILAMLPRSQSQEVNIFGSKFRQHPRFGKNKEARQTDKVTSKEEVMIHSVIDIMDDMMNEKDSDPNELLVDSHPTASTQQSPAQHQEVLKSRLRPVIASVLADPLSSTSSLESKVSRLKEALSQELDPSTRDHILGNKSFDNHAKNLFMRAALVQARNKGAATSPKETKAVTSEKKTNNRRVVRLFQKLGMPEDASTTIAIRTLAPSGRTKLSRPGTTAVVTTTSALTTTQSRFLVLNDASEKTTSVPSAGKKRVRLLKTILQKLPSTREKMLMGHLDLDREVLTTTQSGAEVKIPTGVSTVPASQTETSSLPPPPRRVVLLNSKPPLSSKRKFKSQFTLLGGKSKSKIGSDPVKSVTDKSEQDGMASKFDTENAKTEKGFHQESIPKKVVLLKSILAPVPAQEPTSQVSTPDVPIASQPDSTTPISIAIESGSTSVHEESENKRVVLLKSLKNLFKPSENINQANIGKIEESETNVPTKKVTITEAERIMLPNEVLPRETFSKKVVLLKSFPATSPTQEPPTQVSTLRVSTTPEPETVTTPVPLLAISSSKPEVSSQNRRIVLLKSFPNLFKSSENMTKLEMDTAMSNVEKAKESESDINKSVTEATKTVVENLPSKVLPEETISKKVVLLKSFLVTAPAPAPTQEPQTQVSTQRVSTISEPETVTTPVPVLTISSSKPKVLSSNRKIVLLKSFSNLFKSAENSTKLVTDTGILNVEKAKESELDLKESVTEATKTVVENLPDKVLSEETISKKVVLLKSFVVTAPTQEPHTQVSTLRVPTTSEQATVTTPVPVLTISSSKPEVSSPNRRIVLLKSFSNLFKSSENMTKLVTDTGILNVEKATESELDLKESLTEATKTVVENLPGKVLPEETISKKVVRLKSFLTAPAPTHEPHTRVSTLHESTKFQPDATTPVPPTTVTLVPATTVSSSTSEVQSQDRRVVVLKSFANLFKSPGVSVDMVNTQSSPENISKLESDDSMADKDEGKDPELSKATNSGRQSSTQSSVRILPQESISEKVVLLKSVLVTVSSQVPRTRVPTLDISTIPQTDATTPVPIVNVHSNKSLLNVKVLPKESISEKVNLFKSLLVTHKPHTQVSTVHVSTTSEPSPVKVTTVFSSPSKVQSESGRIEFKTFPNLFKVPKNITKVEARDGMADLVKLKSETEADKIRLAFGSNKNLSQLSLLSTSASASPVLTFERKIIQKPDIVEASNASVPTVKLDDVSKHISAQKEDKFILQNSRIEQQSDVPSTQSLRSKLKIVPLLGVHDEQEEPTKEKILTIRPKVLKFQPAVPPSLKQDGEVPPRVPQPERGDLLNAAKLAKLHALLNQEHISKIAIVTTTTLSPPASSSTATTLSPPASTTTTLSPPASTTTTLSPPASTTTTQVSTIASQEPTSTLQRMISSTSKVFTFSTLVTTTTTMVIKTTTKPLSTNTGVSSLTLKKQQIFRALFPASSVRVLPASPPASVISVLPTTILPVLSSSNVLPDSSSTPSTTILSLPSSTTKLPVSSSSTNLPAAPSTTILPVPVAITDNPASPTIIISRAPLLSSTSTSSTSTVFAFTPTTRLVNIPTTRILSLSSSTRSSLPPLRILSKAPPTRVQNGRLPGVVGNKKFKVKLEGPLVQKSVKPPVSANPGKRFFNKVPYREVVRFLSDHSGGVSLVNTQGHTLAHSKAGHTIPVLNQLPAGLAPTLKITPVIISGLGNSGASPGARRRFF